MSGLLFPVFSQIFSLSPLHSFTEGQTYILYTGPYVLTVYFLSKRLALGDKFILCRYHKPTASFAEEMLGKFGMSKEFSLIV